MSLQTHRMYDPKSDPNIKYGPGVVVTVSAGPSAVTRPPSVGTPTGEAVWRVGGDMGNPCPSLRLCYEPKTALIIKS